MTRFLSQSLQASEPNFRQYIQRLEKANGNPSTDIRLTTEITRQATAVLLELGLDPKDTAPQELYHALLQRLQLDEKRLQRSLQTRAATHISAEANVADGIVHALKDSKDSQRCYALKASSLKRLLKKQPPKKTMKQLGYRSLDSFLKNESAAAILAATKLVEDVSWQHRFTARYKELKAHDFEQRSILIEAANYKRWHDLAEQTVARHRQTVISLPELGAVVLLPIPKGSPAGSVVASLCLALQGLNEIRTASTYLKMHQVKADFGSATLAVATKQVVLPSQLTGQAVSWGLVQQFYSRASIYFSHELFEPYVELEDMVWHEVETSLHAIEETLSFWRLASHAAIVHDGKPVSCNILDVALNLCNRLPFESRVTSHFQSALGHELLLRYFQPKHVEASVWDALRPQLAPEPAIT